MIYLMSQKFLRKNIEKMASVTDYFIIDGENYGISGADSSSAIASDFNKCHSSGGFSPERVLYVMIRKLKDDVKINEEKFRRETKDFLHSQSFIASANAAFKAVIARGPNNPTTVFVVVPGVVYKYLGKKIIGRMNDLTKLDTDVVFSQDDIKEKGIKDCLRKSLKNSTLKALDKATKRIEEKYKIKFSGDIDDEY